MIYPCIERVVLIYSWPTRNSIWKFYYLYEYYIMYSTYVISVTINKTISMNALQRTMDGILLYFFQDLSLFCMILSFELIQYSVASQKNTQNLCSSLMHDLYRITLPMLLLCSWTHNSIMFYIIKMKFSKCNIIIIEIRKRNLYSNNWLTSESTFLLTCDLFCLSWICHNANIFFFFFLSHSYFDWFFFQIDSIEQQNMI